MNRNLELVGKHKFEVNDLVYYVQDEKRERPYLLLHTPDLSLMRTTNGWEACYVYSGIDKETNKTKVFIREKANFEGNFFKLI